MDTFEKGSSRVNLIVSCPALDERFGGPVRVEVDLGGKKIHEELNNKRNLVWGLEKQMGQDWLISIYLAEHTSSGIG